MHSECAKKSMAFSYQDICARNHSPPYYLARSATRNRPASMRLSWQVLLRCLSAVAGAAGVIVPFLAFTPTCVGGNRQRNADRGGRFAPILYLPPLSSPLAGRSGG